MFRDIIRNRKFPHIVDSLSSETQIQIQILAEIVSLSPESQNKYLLVEITSILLKYSAVF